MASDGTLIFPATVKTCLQSGNLVLVYDVGGEAVEKPENLVARMHMPWHPKDVPLHIMMRRNVGRGKMHWKDCMSGGTMFLTC